MLPVKRTTVLPFAIAVTGLAAAISLGLWLEDRRPQLPGGYTDTDLTVLGSRLKGFSFGAEGLLADWYYMRGLQYIGAKMLANRDKGVNLDDLTSLNPRLLYPMLDNATDLDPNFIAAYSYGAVVLPAIDPDKAVALIEKGIRNNPDRWELYSDLGYIYWKLKRYEKAAETYQAGSEIPGAASYMPLMAAAMRTEGGSRETARQIFLQMAAGSDDAMVKLTAERRLRELDWLDERDAIDAVLAELRSRTGQCPSDLRGLIPQLATVTLPFGNEFEVDAEGRLADPSGAPYVLNTNECRVELDRSKTSIAIKNY